jgi:hypothetical protein
VKLFFYNVEANGQVIGTVKHDGYRERLQWTALDGNGRRLADTETNKEAERLIMSQQVDN